MQENQCILTLDYLISSDVFEHTPPPVDVPFKNASKLLKKGGTFILSVPTAQEYVEHFPELNKFEIIETKAGYVLANATSSGALQIRSDLTFHGGPGSTLEMRIFSEEKVNSLLQANGFGNAIRVNTLIPEYGIYPIQGLSSLWVVTRE